jgi:hypothetical protein
MGIAAFLTGFWDVGHRIRDVELGPDAGTVERGERKLPSEASKAA